MPCHRQAQPHCGQHLHRAGGGHQCAPLWCPHLPHQQQDRVAVCEPVCGVQPLHQQPGGQLPWRDLQSALQHEHLQQDVGCGDPRRGKGQDRAAEGGGRHHRPAESGRAGHQSGGHRHLRKAHQRLHRQAVGPPLHRAAGLYHQASAGAFYLRQQLFQRPVSGHPQRRLHCHGGKHAGGHRGAPECGLSG